MTTASSPAKPWWFSPPLILFLAAVVVYAVTDGFDFQLGWDDDLYVLGNDNITSVSIRNILAAFTGYFVGNYAPVHILSYMLDHALWNFNPAGYHLENAVLHALNGVLFYHLLRRTILTEQESWSAAWIFLFHPVQVETVAWISQRKNLLAMTFFLAAFLGYETYRRTGKRVPYLLAACSMAVAVLSKSIAVIFPLAIFLYDLTVPQHRPRSRRERCLDLLPFVLIATAAALMAITSQSLDNGGGRHQYHGGSPAATFFTMVPVLVSYLLDCIWPFGLSPSYDVTVRLAPDMVFIGALGVLLLTAWGGVLLYRKNPALLFWYSLFFIALVPVLQIVPLITLKNDRYLYFPLLGFCALAVKAGGGTVRHLSRQGRSWGKYLLCGLMLLLPLLSFRQSLHWRDDLSLWNYAVSVDPGNRLAASRLILNYTRRGDKESAVAASLRYQEEFSRRQRNNR